MAQVGERDAVLPPVELADLPVRGAEGAPGEDLDHGAGGDGVLRTSHDRRVHKMRLRKALVR
jgi:hypothetical protein